VRAGAVPARGVVVVVPGEAEVGEAAVAVSRAHRRARATLLARTLSAVPSNVKNPPWLADRAVEVAGRTGLGVRVWDEDALRAGGFGGLLAVGGASATPPRLVALEHRPDGADASTLHVVLVGKGITFDTGGLQVKPPEAMLGMTTDMSGAAVVLAVLGACRALEVRVRVTGLLPLAENAVGAGSYRPGDVITHHDGTTVEVGNTDAEGRLVLADALGYAVSGLTPDAVVDVATLTGAARVALARVMAPVFATDDALRDALLAAGEAAGETLWPLPLPAQYRRALDSEVADLRHIAEGGAGAITAALFLREFVGDVPWAHLDIAGPGRSDVDAGTVAKGGTGFGTRLLLRWLEGWR
jgi:leucyl aminopeptidase